MNKVMCYEVNGFQIREYEKVKSTRCKMFFIDSSGDQKERNKNNYNAANIKYFESKYYAVKCVDRKHFENIKASRTIGGETYAQSLRMALEFAYEYPDIESLKEY